MMVRRFGRALSAIVQILLIEMCRFAWSIGSVISRILGRRVAGREGQGRRRTKQRERVSLLPEWLPLGLLILKPALAPATAPPANRGVPFDSGGFGPDRGSRRHHR